MTQNGDAQRYVALLRGINVGGRTTVPMADLRAVCERSGCTDVRTYIASGNVVLSSTLDAASLRRTLEQAVADNFGVAPDIMIRTAEEIAAVVADPPYSDTDRLHVAFLHEPPTEPVALQSIDCAPEELTVRGRDIYLYLPNGVGRARLPVETAKRLRQPSTVRNWRTVTALARLTH